MSENRGDNQDYGRSFDPMRNARRANGDPYNELTDAIYDLLDYMQGHPNNFRDVRRAPTESQSSFSKDNKWKFQDRNSRGSRRYGRGGILDDFEAGIRDQLLDSLAGGSFRKSMERALNEFTKRFGVSLQDLPYEMGKQISKNAFDAIAKSPIGKEISQSATKMGESLLKQVFGDTPNGKAAQDALKNVFKEFKGNNGGSGGSGGGSGGSGGSIDVDQIVNSGQQIIDASENPEIAQQVSELADASVDATSEMAELAEGAGSTATEMVELSETSMAAAEGTGELATGAVVTGDALAGLTAGLMAIAPYVAGALVVFALIEPAISGFIDLITVWGSAFTKKEDMRQKRAEIAQKRLQADLEYMAERPFKILQEAVEKWETTWDANLRKVGQTQGYDKESVYALYEGYADRLRQENLDAVINATDVVDKLSSVLDTGLSGEAAEEFAYIATKLNAAIPTQDFFGFADTYASIASNAIAQGASQADALAIANAELEQFASNLLYSSRELAGGFTTGLKNSSTLFKDAVQIAQSAKTYNSSEISGTLTSVSAIIGSVAPDLADSLVQNVVQAAIGGNNNSQLVALRSLAGINAGNTDFLREMAENPQGVFSRLFTNLAQMQNMSLDNYMEVAEGLAEVFGIDKAAFARVDFNYLAQAIQSMQVNYDSLSANLALLESGQTTTSAEQLKAQEINSVILEEGLAYIIDSEAGRMIQEHMWDEQRANAMMENEYAVNLQGAALSFLEGIRETITNILNWLNPGGYIANGIANLVATYAEMEGNNQDIVELLEAGAVGSNQQALENLTTIGEDLKLTTSLIEMYGGTKGTDSIYSQISDITSGLANVADQFGGIGILPLYKNIWSVASGGNPNASLTDVAYQAWNGDLTNPLGAESFNNTIVPSTILNLSSGSKYVGDVSNSSLTATSRYNWGMVGKSVAQALQTTPINSSSLIGSVIKDTLTATANAESLSQKKMQEFLDSAVEASKTMSYEAYLATAKNFGISDVSEALTKFGVTEEKLRGYFEANQVREGAIKEEARKADEQLFRDENRTYWDYTSGTGGVFQTAMWLPFFGDSGKYDTRMTAVDEALSNIQTRIGVSEDHTVISGIEELSNKLGETTTFTVISGIEQLHTDISTTFILGSSLFQRCLRDWIRYIEASESYTNSLSRSSAWSDLQAAEKGQQTEATLALANALKVFSADELQKMDPQLQTNALLGEIVVILQAIMQQNNTVGGSLSLPDQFSALGMGITLNKPA